MTGLDAAPLSIATAATATALVPDDGVSPAPRSHTSAVTSEGPSKRASWTFVRSGKRGWRSTSGPRRRSSAGQARARARRADCRPRPASARRPRRPRRWSRAARSRPCRPASRPSCRREGCREPPVAPTRTTTSCSPERSASQRAAIRVPLPESSAVEPSGFQITTSASAPSALTTSSTPSAPMPSCGSQSRRAERRLERRAELSSARRAGRSSRARATSRISSAISPGGRSARRLTRPGIRRIHLRW